MFAKLTAKNQITIPKKVIEQLPNVRYFDVELKDGFIVLKPLHVYDTDLERLRSKIKKLGLKQDCVAEAIKWQGPSKTCRYRYECGDLRLFVRR